MVPVILPFVRAEVSAGTANAARIAIIAITTSNSMSVNAEKNFFILIFMWVFFSAGCSEGFGRGGLPEPPDDLGQSPLQVSVSQRVLFLGFPWVWCFSLGCR